jgi:hypothetical protein
VKLVGDTPFPGGVNTYILTTNQTSGYFFGDPVNLIGGQVVPIAASPTTAAANNVIGVFMGCSYQDPIRGFVNSQYLPANVISGGASNVRLKVADNPDLVMAVQANGSVTADKIGMNAGLVGPFAGGNVNIGNSVVALDAASIAVTATLAVRIYGFVINASPSPGASSAPGDPFTDVLVIWNQGTHRFDNVTGQ